MKKLLLLAILAIFTANLAQSEILTETNKLYHSIDFGYFVPDKKKFLHIVDELAKANGIALDEETLHLEAEKFVTQRATRSPRTAQQFIKSLL